MTLTSPTVRAQFDGDGSTTAFPISFVFWKDADIKAVLKDANGVETTWVLGTQYTLTGGSATGATGTLTAITSPTDYTPATGETLTITSNLTKTQDTDLPAGGAFPSDSVEAQMDKIVRMGQQDTEVLGRSLKFPISDDAALSAELPNSGDRASKYLGFDSSGNVTGLAAPTDTSLTTTFTQTLLDDATAAAFRTTLEVDAARSLALFNHAL